MQDVSCVALKKKQDTLVRVCVKKTKNKSNLREEKHRRAINWYKMISVFLSLSLPAVRIYGCDDLWLTVQLKAHCIEWSIALQSQCTLHYF